MYSAHQENLVTDNFTVVIQEKEDGAKLYSYNYNVG